jgi:acyl-coenzyme A thioesterase PaaI-like protein
LITSSPRTIKPHKRHEQKNQRNQETRTVEHFGPTGSRYGPQGRRLTIPNTGRRTTAQGFAVGPAILAGPQGFGAGGAV